VRELIAGIAAIAMIVFCNAFAVATTYKVSDMATLRELCVQKANPGDAIEIQPGTYYLDVSHIPVLRSGEPGRPVTIRGVVRDGKRPVIDASRVNVKRGIFREEEGTHDIVYEDLELCNAWGSRFPDQETFGTNAGAIYFLGRNVTARRIHTHHNEDGWFATDTADNLLIENCEIDHNGTLFEGEHNGTHNFYFCAHRQTVRNCYIHHSGEAQNFKSRGYHTVFAYNWVEEDGGYSVEVASGNEGNTLWIGNVIVKRKAGPSQRRILGVGDGTEVAEGTLVMVNNTIISTTQEDIYLFTQERSTCNVVLVNNVFAGPSAHFLDRYGKGTITGSHNWFQTGMEVPDTLTDSIFGDDPDFAEAAGGDFHPTAGSPLVGAGTIAPASRDETGAVQVILPSYEPSREAFVSVPRAGREALDIGAFQSR